MTFHNSPYAVLVIVIEDDKRKKLVLREFIK